MNRMRQMCGALLVALGLFGSGCGTRLASADSASRATRAGETGEQSSRQSPGTPVQWWLSSENGKARLTAQPDLRFHLGPSRGRDVIQLDDAITHQPVLGLGSSFEHSTCYNHKPNVSGFHDCDPTLIVLHRDTLETEYRADYYIYGQFMKFIQPGAVRVATTAPLKAPANVAFKNPDGSFVLVAANAQNTERDLSLAWRGGVLTTTLDSRSVATLRWTQ